ncbi:hypothetical protein TIFTF001_042596 [Ficus carica]|uniref:Uncharacterized protein n=1 Tax=Ficus carica TaxID=3494 RepID=A0AA88CYX2_FICCA|nr:hypothetical protein TIFTF001_042596 [Ficus carica]
MNDRGSAHHREADNHGSENGQRNVPAMAAIVIGHLFVERRVHQATRLHIGSTINSRARGCIGAIDGTHIPCVPPLENADA